MDQNKITYGEDVTVWFLLWCCCNWYWFCWRCSLLLVDFTLTHLGDCLLSLASLPPLHLLLPHPPRQVIIIVCCKFFFPISFPLLFSVATVFLFCFFRLAMFLSFFFWWFWMFCAQWECFRCFDALLECFGLADFLHTKKTPKSVQHDGLNVLQF